MTHDEIPPEVWEIKLPKRLPDPVKRVGVSSWGTVYRSRGGAACYRVVPRRAASLEMRKAALDLVGRPRRLGIAPVMDADQDENEAQWFVMRYEVDSGFFLSDAFAKADTQSRIEHFTAAFRQRNYWRGQFPNGFLPMPADIAFEDNTPYVLQIPQWSKPDIVIEAVLNIEAVLAVPERGLYLSPQFVRGMDINEWSPTGDIYAFGVMMLQCLYNLPASTDPEARLSRIASGSVYDAEHLERDLGLPFWMERVPGCRRVVSLVQRMVNPNNKIRAAIDLAQACQELDAARQEITPLQAMRSLRKAGKASEAFALFQDILLETASYEVLLLGGEIAFHDLNNKLEAMDVYERAIQQYPDERLAYRQQFGVLAKATEDLEFRKLSHLTGMHKKIAWMMQRDLAKLPPEEQTQCEYYVAWYLIEIKEYVTCAYFIFPRLFRNQDFLWGKFSMRLLYAEALLGAAKQLVKEKQHNEAGPWLNLAQNEIASIRGGLYYAHDIHSMSLEEIQQYGKQLGNLEAELLRIQSKH